MVHFGFDRERIDSDWQELINAGPRFLGTENEVISRQYILDCLADTSACVKEHEFHYTGWTLVEPPKLMITAPSSYVFPCEVFIGSSPTPKEGICGTVQYVGKHKVIGAFEWSKFAVLNPDGNLVAYISGRPNGPAQPQPLDRGSAPIPHFIIGAYELSLLTSWLDRQLKVEIQGTIRCTHSPNSITKNVIASFSPNSSERRIALSAHYDSVYSAPGANDNAGAVAALLAIARRMTKEKMNLPIDLLFFAGEEWDLIGSRAYVADLKDKNGLDNLKMVVNLDSIAEGSSLEIWAGPESFEEQIRKVIGKFPNVGSRKVSFYFPPPGSSDHMPFYEAGVPACMLFCGETVKYHVAQDTYCPEGVENILYVAEFAWNLLRAFSTRDVAWSSWISGN
jgi:hypothetical protein